MTVYSRPTFSSWWSTQRLLWPIGGSWLSMWLVNVWSTPPFFFRRGAFLQYVSKVSLFRGLKWLLSFCSSFPAHTYPSSASGTKLTVWLLFRTLKIKKNWTVLLLICFCCLANTLWTAREYEELMGCFPLLSFKRELCFVMSTVCIGRYNLIEFVPRESLIDFQMYG